MSCIEGDRDTREMEVSDMMAAVSQKARDAAVLATEAAVLTYRPGAVWINPVLAIETEHSLRQALASIRHVIRYCRQEAA